MEHELVVAVLFKGRVIDAANRERPVAGNQPALTALRKKVVAAKPVGRKAAPDSTACAGWSVPGAVIPTAGTVHVATVCGLPSVR